MNQAFERRITHSLADEARWELLGRASKAARISDLTDEQLHELVRQGEELSKLEEEESTARTREKLGIVG